MNDPSKRIREALYNAAVEIDDPAALQAFMRILARGDRAHYEWLIEVLKAQKDAEKFIRGIEEAWTVAVLETGSALMNESETALTDELAPDTEDPIGQRIGRYQLLERIGEGGCGIVYLAEQKEPVHRMVALKVIRLGMDTERVIARFEAERQSLAIMDHPNIARVFDAGATETGRPYFVMERVLGPRITEYCDENQLGLRDRIELFIAVCGGIQHAHQKGILHRDIKPSNILVTRADDKPLPKVIDFGIAKAIEEDLGIGTALTMNDLFAGTPAYMSPEQADLKTPDIDTRSDVYGLGVLLYELLTGRTPFDPKKLAAAGLREMRRILVEQDPPSPSGMIASLPAGEQERIASRRRLDPSRLIAEIRGDLDAVVMKAMEKERQRRYEAINELIFDLQRYLACQPVLARRQSRLYLFTKFVRRNRVAIGATAAVMISLCLGLGIAAISHLKERRAREEQAQLRRMAEQAHAGELQQQAEAQDWENMAQISMLLSEGRIPEADEKLRQTPVASMKITPESAGVLRSLANWNAMRGRWPEAANWFNLLMVANEAGPLQDAVAMDILATGAALVEAGNVEDYEHFQHWVLRRFGPNSDDLTAERVLHASLLMPTKKSLLIQFAPFQERLAQTQFDPERLRPGWPSEAAAWRAWALAMLDLRSGRDAEAKYWIQQALRIPVRPKFMPALLHSTLAMAEHRLGNADAAAASLKNAREVIDEAFAAGLPPAYEPMGKQQGYWWDWVITHRLYREASDLIANGRR